MCWEMKWRWRLRRVECDEPGINAHRVSEEWGSRSCWRRVQRGLQIQFAGVEATHLLVYVACWKGNLAGAQGPTRCRSQRWKV